MTEQVVLQLSEDEIAALDAEVARGRAADRSEAVHRCIAALQRDQRRSTDEAALIDLVRRREFIYPDLDGVLDSPRPPLD